MMRSGADLNDPDHDGVPNLIEFATAADPLAPDPDQLVQAGNELIYALVQRPAQMAADLTYQMEWADTPSGPWTAIPDFRRDLFAEFQTMLVWHYHIPLTADRKFVRLRVTKIQ